MPVVGEPVFDENKRASWFSHKGEEAKAYYYKVYLAEHDVVTELVPTERAALFRFTFPENEHSYVVIDAFDKGSYVKIDAANNRIIGYSTKNSGGVPDNFKNYFVIDFDKPFTYKATVADSCISVDKAEQEANHAGAIIGFATRKGEKVHARVASSFISQAQALENLKELGNDSFDALVEKGKTAWNEALGRIEVEGGNLDQYRMFYSCLYRSLLFPRKFYEIDANGRCMNPLANSLLPSSTAPAFDGPMTGMCFKASSCLKKSYTPFTSGSSGPTTTMSIPLSMTNCLIPSKSSALMATFSPTSRVPAFPGAMYNFSIFGLCAIFHASACSRPPEPNSKSFILCICFLVDYFKWSSK